MKPLGRVSESIYSITRIVAGFVFFLHGAQKLFGVLGQEAVDELVSLRGLAGIIELFGGALITLGLYTGWASFIASGEMAFAYFISHNPQGFWPVMNGGERAVLYCFVFLYFAAHGSGPLSVDRIILGRKNA